MTDKKILQKAIEKASENGYIAPVAYKKNKEKCLNFSFSEPTYVLEMPYFIIFSHDFAKAFFGGTSGHKMPEDAEMGDKCLNCGDWYMAYEKPYESKFCWQMHLRKMVVEENPIQYLKQFLDEEDSA